MKYGFTYQANVDSVLAGVWTAAEVSGEVDAINETDAVEAVRKSADECGDESVFDIIVWLV